MISIDDARSTYEYSSYYKILPAINGWEKDDLRIKKGIKLSENFNYTSENNSDWMTSAYLKKWIEANKNSIGKI